MGLEQVYKQIDTHPEGYPFRPGRAFPSNDWVSQNRVDFQIDYVPNPPARLPDIVRIDEGRAHNPHGKHVYHIWKIDSGAVPVCDVRSLRPLPAAGGTPPTTEFQRSFPPKCSSSTPRQHIFCKASPRTTEPALGIVPGTELVKQTEERMLPACRRDKIANMSTKPFLQYTGKKKKHGQPYRDNGVFYSKWYSDPQSGGRHWLSVSSLTGQSFSRRKHLFGPNNSLPVRGFNGGPPSLPRSAGVRCGYSYSDFK